MVPIGSEIYCSCLSDVLIMFDGNFMPFFSVLTAYVFTYYQLFSQLIV
uniref:Uncharacterized protein n=1 Tax=Rhizophora mucronata TaxID=61149 RepID=A0A2P2PYM7_RHIMU